MSQDAFALIACYMCRCAAPVNRLPEDEVAGTYENLRKETAALEGQVDERTRELFWQTVTAINEGAVKEDSGERRRQLIGARARYEALRHLLDPGLI